MADTTKETAPVVAADVAAQAQSAQVQADERAAEERQADESPEGGKYLVNGVLVNAYGNEIDKNGKLKNPDDAFKQQV